MAYARNSKIEIIVETITNNITAQTLTDELLKVISDKDKLVAYRLRHKEWLEAAVTTNNVQLVQVLLRHFPSIVKDYKSDGFPCAHAFEMQNLEMLEVLLTAGADITLPYKNAKNLISFAYELFLNKGYGLLGFANPYRHCMQTLLSIRPTDADDKAGYNEILKKVLIELGFPQPKVPGLRKLSIRLLQAGANPNSAKEYFYKLIENPNPELIEIMRRFGADFQINVKTPVEEMSISDFATLLSLTEKAASKKQKFLDCKNAINREIASGKTLYLTYIAGTIGPVKQKEDEDRNREVVKSILFLAPSSKNGILIRKEIKNHWFPRGITYEENDDKIVNELIANKDAIIAYFLQLPVKERIEKLEEIGLSPSGATTNVISFLMWQKRGITAPKPTDGLRARIARALIAARLQLQQLEAPAQSDLLVEEDEKESISHLTPAQQAEEKLSAQLVAPTVEARPIASTTQVLLPLMRSTTESLHSPLSTEQPSEPQPPALSGNPPQAYRQPSYPRLEPVYPSPSYMSTNLFNAEMANLPNVQGLPTVSELKEQEKKLRVFGQ